MSRLARALPVALLVAGCVPSLEVEPREPETATPLSYIGSGTQTAPPPASEAPAPAQPSIKQFFADDPALTRLIDVALRRNQELLITNLEVDISNWEVLAKQGEYLPKVGVNASAGLEKVGEDTSQGRSDEAHRVKEHLPDYLFGLSASWEIDIWGKLRDARDGAAKRYLSGVEGRKFLVTGLVAEVASSYYELMALDNLLELLEQNLEVLSDALGVVRLQKQAGKVTELAVKRFEAEVLKNRSRLFVVRQEINETETRLNLLLGQYRQPVDRDSRGFGTRSSARIAQGLPAALLQNRPDVRQAELELEAAKLDVGVARASFYPAVSIDGELVYHSFRAASLVDTPASLAYLIAARISAPLWNRYELTATYFAANARQMQAVLEYERTIVRAFNEVANQLTAIQNLEGSQALLTQQVERLGESVAISGDLFRSARADYMEVLLTRREALEARMELIETRRKRMVAEVKLYRALGGGWE